MQNSFQPERRKGKIMHFKYKEEILNLRERNKTLIEQLELTEMKNRVLQQKNAILESQLSDLQKQNQTFLVNAEQAVRFAAQWDNFLRYDGTPQPKSDGEAAEKEDGHAN